MKSKSLIACMTLLGCFSVAALPVQAADEPEQKVGESQYNQHELEVGSRVPEQFRRNDDAVIQDWKAKGLEEPAKQSEWIQINDKYVRFQKVNGQIVDIVPIKK